MEEEINYSQYPDDIEFKKWAVSNNFSLFQYSFH